MDVMDHSVIELRQYTLHPGRRDDFIARFEREFVDTQEAAGIHVVGFFVDLDDPDRFVWLRSFASYDDRARALTAFYVDGLVWARLRDETNADLIDSDDVLMLTPREHEQAPPGERDEVEIHVWAAGSDAEESALVDALGGVAADVLATSHPGANNFPQQPIRDDRVVVLVGPTSPVEIGGQLQRLRLSAPRPAAPDRPGRSTSR